MEPRHRGRAPKSGWPFAGVAGVFGVLVVFGLVGVGFRVWGSDDGETLDVFAAASLTEVFTELAETYEARSPGTDVRLNFAGSSALREQLIDGADADVFASADEANMEPLIAAGRVAPDPWVFATNRLVLAVPESNPAGVVGLGDLARRDLFVGVCARGVPCGDLAAETLDAAGVVASADTYEPNVRSLVNRLADGELDVALVYLTDVQAPGSGLEIVPTDLGDSHTSYPIAPILDEAGGVSAEANAFVAFVLSPEGRSVLESWGFAAP